MKNEKLGVGIIGASPNGGWGSTAHVPALQSLPDFEITAIGTSRQESANEAASKFNVPHAFTDPYELSTHPDVDIVAITVKVPEHSKLVKAAFQAGKHVYCEWPLARTTKEAVELLNIAQEKGVRHVVGLQARANPTINYVKDLLTSGYVGNVLSVNVSYSMPSFPTVGNTIDQAHAYLLDVHNGADQLTITAGHLLDGINYLLGDFSQVSAILETQVKQVKVIETGQFISATAPDHVVVNGILDNGAIVSTHVRNTNAASFILEINGTKGDLMLVSRDKMMFEMDPFILKGSQGRDSDLAELMVPSKYYLVPSNLHSGPAFNVAQLYAQFYQDLQMNTYETPNFHTGVQVHRLLDKVRESASSGLRQSLKLV